MKLISFKYICSECNKSMTSKEPDIDKVECSSCKTKKAMAVKLKKARNASGRRAEAIYELREKGASYKLIAEVMGVTPHTVGQLCRHQERRLAHQEKLKTNKED